MKRFLSLFIAVVMVASMCVISAPAATAATLDAHNVGIEVPHYSGSLYFNELIGKATTGGIAEVYADDVLIKEAHELKKGDLIDIIFIDEKKKAEIK